MEPGAWGNKTVVTEFILLGLTENIELQPILFAIFLFAYVITVGGNLSILAAIFVEPKLHTPMYYFLGNLSLLDIGCITVTVPPMLVCLLTHQCRVPYAACISQLFFFHLLAGVDCHLLTAMAYDRYLAICQPLTYSIRMSRDIQGALVAVCCSISFINALTHTVAVSVLDFCGPNVLNHFYCDTSSHGEPLAHWFVSLCPLIAHSGLNFPSQAGCVLCLILLTLPCPLFCFHTSPAKSCSSMVSGSVPRLLKTAPPSPHCHPVINVSTSAPEPTS